MLIKINYLLLFFIFFNFLFFHKDTVISIEEGITPGGIAYIFYNWPKVPEGDGQKGYYNLDIDMNIEKEPKKSAYYYWAHQFKFVDNSEGGYLGLQKIGDNKKIAIFSIWGAIGGIPGKGGIAQPFSGEGEGWQCLLPFEWIEGITYTLRVWELCCVENPDSEETWGAWVINTRTGLETLIGEIKVPGNYKWLDSWSTSWVEYFSEVDDCNNLPYFKNTFTNLKANDGEFKPTKTSFSKGSVCNNIQITEINKGFRIEKNSLYITPSSLTFSMDENATKTDYLKITNTGDGELKGTVSESESWMSVSPTSFEGDSTIQVTIDSDNLSEGSYSGEIEVKSNGGNQTIPVTVRVSEQDTSPPVLQITSPKDETETEEMQILVKGRVYDDESGIDTLTLNGEELYVDSKGYFEYYYDLSYGENTLELEAENKVGLITSKVLTVYRFDPDNTAPEITISYPQPNQNVYETPLIVKGSVTDEGSGVKSVMVNEKEVSFDEDGNFEATVSLELGKNTIQVEAVDYKGNKGSKTIYVQYLEKKPIVILLWIGNRIALVDSEPVTLDTPPLIYKGRTMVPVRFIAEAFGADVFYDAAEQEIDIAFGSVYISLWVNKTRARIEVTENGQRNNRIVILDAPPIIRNGRTLVPVRFIAEAFGATIDWDGKEEKITITLLAGSQGGNPPPPAGAEEVNQRGNSVGNIVNLGLVAQQGEWIY